MVGIGAFIRWKSKTHQLQAKITPKVLARLFRCVAMHPIGMARLVPLRNVHRVSAFIFLGFGLYALLS
jgi:hypothetical protein